MSIQFIALVYCFIYKSEFVVLKREEKKKRILEICRTRMKETVVALRGI
jgi:hypothetical protein